MDYQGNTDKEREAKGDKQIIKVVTGEVIQKPESVGKKFKNIFFGGDLKTSARFVAADVMLPAFRDLLVDAIVNGAKGVIYGDSRFRRRDAEYRPRVQYSNPINRPSYRDVRDRERRPFLPDQPHPYRHQNRIDRADVFLEKKEDAEVVVERLIDIIDQYQVASLADYYSLLGEPSSPIDNKWGWYSLNSVDIRQTRDGYCIELPPLEAI
jgi:hypothetical protein